MLLRNFLAGSILVAATLFLANAQDTPVGQPREVPFVPTTEAAVQEMLKLANVKSTDLVYDLGCGDGRIVIAAAQTYGAHGVGIDIDPQRIQDAEENARRAGVANLVRFEEKDLFQADVHEATVVTLFLVPRVNLRLRPKLERELQPGTRIVSNTFGMGNWKPARKVLVASAPGGALLNRQLFLWIVPPPKQQKRR